MPTGPTDRFATPRARPRAGGRAVVVALLAVAACGSAPAPVEAPPASASAVGEQTTWALQSRQQMRMFVPQRPSGFVLELQGQWRWTVVEDDGVSQQFLVELIDPALFAPRDDGTTLPPIGALEMELTTPILIERARDGRFTAARIAPGMHPEASQRALDLLAALEWGEPWGAVADPAASWARKVGEVEVRFDPTRTGPVAGRLSVLGYRMRTELPPELSTARLLNSGHFGAFSLGADGLPAEVMIEQVAGLRVPGWDTTAAGKRVSVSLMQRARVDAGALVPWAEVLTQRVSLPSTADPPRPGPLAPPPSGQRLADLREAAHRAEVRGRRGWWEAFTAMVALLRAQPFAVVEAEQAARRGAPDALTLITALGDAGTDEAQAALRALWGDPAVAPEARERALAVVSRARAPAPETVAALLRALEEPGARDDALRALGSAAGKLTEVDTARAEAVVRYLIGRLDQVRDGTPLPLLRALRDADLRSVPAGLRRFLEGGAEADRVAAFDVVASIRTEDATDALIVGCRDPSEAIRALAVASLGLRQPDGPVVDVITRLALSEPSFSVRVLAVRALAGWGRSDAAVAAALRDVSDHERDPAIKAIVESIPR